MTSFFFLRFSFPKMYGDLARSMKMIYEGLSFSSTFLYRAMNDSCDTQCNEQVGSQKCAVYKNGFILYSESVHSLQLLDSHN